MANGNFGGGIGTDGSPFIVEDASDLFAMHTKPPTSRFEIKNPINCSGRSGYIPPGNYGDPFTGKIFGNLKPIRNLHVSTSGPAGLLGYYRGTHLVGIVIEDSSFHSSGDHAGSIAGYSGASNGVFRDCHISGVTVLGKVFGGGLFGYCSDSLIDRCTFKGTCRADNAGGIVAGGSPKAITDCSSSGLIEGTDGVAGGIIGNAQGGISIKNCLVEADVFGLTKAYGVAYANSNATTNVNNCFVLSRRIGKYRGSNATDSSFGFIASSQFYGTNNYYTNDTQFVAMG